MTEPEPTRPRPPWGKLSLALLVLAAAHAALFLLLTAEWRKERRGIEERVGPALETSAEPAPVSGADPAASRAYAKARELWEDRVRRDQLAARTKMFATGFAGAYLAEVVLLGLAVFRVLSGRVKRPGPPSAPGR